MEKRKISFSKVLGRLSPGVGRVSREEAILLIFSFPRASTSLSLLGSQKHRWISGDVQCNGQWTLAMWGTFWEKQGSTTTLWAVQWEWLILLSLLPGSPIIPLLHGRVSVIGGGQQTPSLHHWTGHIVPSHLGEAPISTGSSWTCCIAALCNCGGQTSYSNTSQGSFSGAPFLTPSAHTFSLPLLTQLFVDSLGMVTLYMWELVSFLHEISVSATENMGSLSIATSQYDLRK